MRSPARSPATSPHAPLAPSTPHHTPVARPAPLPFLAARSPATPAPCAHSPLRPLCPIPITDPPVLFTPPRSSLLVSQDPWRPVSPRSPPHPRRAGASVLPLTGLCASLVSRLPHQPASFVFLPKRFLPARGRSRKPPAHARVGARLVVSRRVARSFFVRVFRSRALPFPARPGIRGR